VFKRACGHLGGVVGVNSKGQPEGKYRQDISDNENIGKRKSGVKKAGCRGGSTEKGGGYKTRVC